MPHERSSGNITEGMADNNSEVLEPRAKRRKVFLQTMGQQLREVGMLQDNPGESVVNATSNTGDTPRVQSSNDPHGTDGQRARKVQIQTPESDEIPGEDDSTLTGVMTGASRNLWLPGETLTIPVSDENDAFNFEDLLAWTRSYFDNWHPAYPFLHAPSTLEYFESIAHHGVIDRVDTSTYEFTILRSLISISLADYRQMRTTMRPVPTQLVFASFNDAIHSVQCVLTEETSIISLQAVLSVQIFLISMLRYAAASRLEDLAVRMAFHLGLHRCPAQLSNVLKQEIELRQRVFWSVYCIDRSICIRLGVPLGIRDSDIDTCLPTAEIHDDVAEGRSDHDDRLDLLGFLAENAEIRGSISELRNKSVSNRQTESDESVVIEAQLTKWWNGVEEYLDSNSSDSIPISQYHRMTLAILKHESVITLNKHTLATSKKNSGYDAALQNCIGAARSIINILYKELETLKSPGTQVDTEYSGLLWHTFTWAVWMSAFLAMYAANEDQISQDVAIRLADRALEVLKHLTRRGTIWPHACAVTIRGLRGQQIDRRNRSRHTHAHKNNNNQEAQNENNTRTHPRSNPHQSSTNIESHSTYNGSTGVHQLLPPIHTESQSYQTHPTSLSSMPRQFTGQHNWIFSDLMPNFGDFEGNGNVNGMINQLGIDIQVPNNEWAEFFTAVDAPFWIAND